MIVRGEIVGCVDYDTDQDWLGPGQINVGYNIVPAHRRCGYATQAVKLLCQHLAQHGDLQRAYFAIDAENHASIAVASALRAIETHRYLTDNNRPNIRYRLAIVADG